MFTDLYYDDTTGLFYYAELNWLKNFPNMVWTLHGYEKYQDLINSCKHESANETMIRMKRQVNVRFKP